MCACGKGGDGLKTCNACKLAKYCNATCQRAQRREHKKECKRRAAELFDGALFKEPQPQGECPICCLPLPILAVEQQYQSCCGKTLCAGCIHEVYKRGGVDSMSCPFCRTSAPTAEGELVERLKKRMEGDDAHATHNLGGHYAGNS